MANNKPKKMTQNEAIQKVLAESPEPLTYREITERIEAQNLLESSEHTPVITKVTVAICDSIRKHGERSPYQRVEGKKFKLAVNVSPKILKVSKVVDYQEKGTKQGTSSIISSFGIFWKRDRVNWKKRQMWGQQDGRSKIPHINFWEQRGIYLLYGDRDEVIYVGRSEQKKGLGERLHQHTKDKNKTRLWNEFSWFGFRPVNPDASLGEIPATCGTEKLIPILEAALIAALKPAKNQQEGDGLEKFRYSQIQIISDE